MQAYKKTNFDSNGFYQWLKVRLPERMTSRQWMDIFHALNYTTQAGSPDLEWIQLMVSEVIPGVTQEEISVFFRSSEEKAGMNLVEEIVGIFEDYLNQVKVSLTPVENSHSMKMIGEKEYGNLSERFYRILSSYNMIGSAYVLREASEKQKREGEKKAASRALVLEFQDFLIENRAKIASRNGIEVLPYIELSVKPKLIREVKNLLDVWLN